MIKKKPPKEDDVLGKIKACIEAEKYTITKHAIIRQKERNINIAEIVYVLKNGYEEKKKTCFDDPNNAWKYSIRGKTKIDKQDVRVIVSFDEDGMLIITVMHVGGL